MTTSSYDNVTVSSQSSSGAATAWTLSSVTSSTTNTNYADITSLYRNSKWLDLSIPEFMSGILAGSEFVSMNVKFKAYDNDSSAGPYLFSVRQNSVETYSTSVSGTDTAFQTFSGDKSFWGFTGTVQQIIADLTSGAIKFRFYGASTISVKRCDMKDFQVQLVYSSPDMKRASVVQVLA